jgi:Protein of unknown function (DUF1302)
MGESARRVGSWQVRVLGVLLVGVLVASGTNTARATIKYGPLQLSGNFETQNLIRHSSIDKYQFIQNRNTFRLRIDWDWLQNGKLVDKFDLPFIERSKLFLLYRGVYDGFYDIVPSDNQVGQTRYDDLIGGSIGKLSDSFLTQTKFEDRIREAYIDLKLKDAPVSFRLGRQQVIWGESDQFRLMDIWNPLDITWHFQQESWDNIRVPLWLGKALWDIGDVGPLSNTFLEVVYNPFDFQPGIKSAFLPQPWGLPFPNPLRSGQISNATELGGPNPPVGGTLLSPQFNLQGTSLTQGNFKRNPAEASEVGLRFHGVTPQGLEFALNYIYGRGRGVGAASPFAVKIEQVDLPGFPPPASTTLGHFQPGFKGGAIPVFPVNIRAEVIHPYMHIFGLTGNYFEGDYTQTVFRFETAYAMGEPFQTTEPDKLVPISIAGVPAPSLGSSPLGFTKRDVWAGMIGFDRPTWIRWLNSKATWFVSGQFFWNYTTGGHIDQLVGNGSAGDDPYYGPVGVWTDGAFAGQVEREQRGNTAVDPLALGNGDNVRQWEHLVTLAATSFYRGGTVVPFVANAWDPVNANDEILWNIDYFFTNNLIFTVQQKFFTAFGRNKPSNDPWFAGGRFTRRDETGVKVTYQF